MSATQTQSMNRIPDPLNSQHREVPRSTESWVSKAGLVEGRRYTIVNDQPKKRESNLSFSFSFSNINLQIDQS